MLDVVIPCRDDWDTLNGVIRTFRSHPRIGNIIVVSNGPNSWESERTIGIGQDAICLNVGDVGGKGQAVKRGLDLVETERVILCDADLTGLTHSHVQLLTRPFTGMVVGIPDRPERMPVPWPVPDNVWQLVSGERSLPTALIRGADLHGYCMEVQINEIARRAALPVRFLHMFGLTGKVRKNDRRMEELRRDREWLGQNWPPS